MYNKSSAMSMIKKPKLVGFIEFWVFWGG